MKHELIIYTFNDPKYYRDDVCKMVLNGKELLSVGGGEAEDNSTSRDLNFVYSIPGWLSSAVTWGYAGDVLTVVDKAMTFDEAEEKGLW